MSCLFSSLSGDKPVKCNLPLNTHNSPETITICYFEMRAFKKVKIEICDFLNCFDFSCSTRLACFCTSQDTITLIIFTEDSFWQQNLLAVPESCSCLSLLLVLLINVSIWLIMYLIMSRIFKGRCWWDGCECFQNRLCVTANTTFNCM